MCLLLKYVKMMTSVEEVFMIYTWINKDWAIAGVILKVKK